MSVQVLLASVAGILFLLMCVLGIIYLIDAFRIKKENKSCIDALCNFVGMEGYFDTKSKVFFKYHPQTPVAKHIAEFEKCQFPDFEGYVPHIIPCKIAAIRPVSRYTPEFIAFVDLDISVPIHIYVKILYVGKKLVIFDSLNTPETVKPIRFFANKQFKKGDVVSLDLIITKTSLKSFYCYIEPSTD